MALIMNDEQRAEALKEYNPKERLIPVRKGRVRSGERIEPVDFEHANSNGRFINLTGIRYGKLVVVSFAGRYKSPSGKSQRFVWKCQCDCGNISFVPSSDLTRLHTTSCGCSPIEQIRNSPGRYRKPEGTSAFNQFYYAYKRSATRRKIGFSLTKDDFRILTQMPCFYCGVLPSHIADVVRGTNGDYICTGIDRIDSAQGYTLDNVRPCCKQCNYAKRDLSEQEFYAWIKRIAAHSKEI